MTKYGSNIRMTDEELAFVAAAIKLAAGQFLGEDDTTSNELRIERAYDDISAIGEKRLGSEGFAALRDEMMARIGRVI